MICRHDFFYLAVWLKLIILVNILITKKTIKQKSVLFLPITVLVKMIGMVKIETVTIGKSVVGVGINDLLAGITIFVFSGNQFIGVVVNIDGVSI